MRLVTPEYFPDEEDIGLHPVEIDITLISNDLYDQLLREFHKQHGYGIYIRWQITALKGDTE